MTNSKFLSPYRLTLMNAGNLKALAQSLGVSKTTVSVALRGKPGVSEALRAKIFAAAKDLGYSPNPAAAELMAMVRSNRKSKGGTTIAFINTFKSDPSLMTMVHSFRNFVEGASHQANEYGYQLEVFSAHGQGMTPKRLDQVLVARGVRGVLVGPRWLDEPELEMDWSAYSSVLVGETTYKPGIYRVCNHHAQTTELTLKNMANLGYRRIGVEFLKRYELERRFEYLAGLTPARATIGSRVRFVVRNQTPFLKSQDLLAAELQKWVKVNRLDSLVSLLDYPRDVIASIKTESGLPLGYARLDTDPSSNITGADQHSLDVGRTAMETLRGLLHNGEKGIKSQPRTVLIESEWRVGNTASARE